MENYRLLLVLATLAFIGGLVHAVVVLKKGGWRESRWHLLPMALGFALQTAFLYFRGRALGQCPMKSLPDILVFIAWSIALLYFLVGGAYRLSLLGLFTAPLVAAMQILALLLPGSFGAYPAKDRIIPLVELHAAVALIAYAAFALACITGVMYLMQERMLKRHRIGGLFYQLPPIQDLAKSIRRLALLGLMLLTAALGMSMALHHPVSSPKVIFAWAVWLLYGGMSVVMCRHMLSPRQTAWLAVVGFVVPFMSLWLVTGK
ncbi:MAG: cytochrome c biogenesis protein CcsA [Verrucomicrobiaceae bacterium]|nr:cytochrome c biogenesis protein CcsA [Verrucomicrobiaceae bacterium]